MSAGEHYQAAMRTMDGHDLENRTRAERGALPMTAEQSTEGAVWVCAHALMGLLAERLDAAPPTE